MFSKVLVANRGEIAVRAFRAAYEVGARTVAVFPHEDRWSEHRLKADEAYEIGERGHPVRAYLDPDAIVEVALRAGADAIYPGYGFLSENPDLAEACANAGITFVGPTARGAEADRQQGPRDRGGRGGRRPTLASVEPSTDLDEPGRRRRGAADSVVREGGRRRRRARDAPGRRPVEAAGGGGDLHARGGGRVRRPDGVHRAGGRRAAAHRGADPGRRRGQRDPPVRARLLGAAAAPEGHRDRAGTASRPGAAGPDLRRRGAVRPADRLPQRRHRGVPGRRRGKTCSSR